MLKISLQPTLLVWAVLAIMARFITNKTCPLWLLATSLIWTILISVEVPSSAEQAPFPLISPEWVDVSGITVSTSVLDR